MVVDRINMRVFVPTADRELLQKLLATKTDFIPILYCHFVWNYRGKKGKNGFLVSSVKEPGFNPEYGDFEF